MRRRWKVGGVIALLLGGLYLANASWLAPRSQGQPGLLAHRGVHQSFRREGLTRDSCTATRMNPPTNPYLKNTLASMTASFAAGATALELDVHPTTDGEFAVFHDWTLECRTNGHGVTRDQSMAYLKTLDVGYGYTADGGRTFPFRGKGIGAMPSLEEVMAAFPGKRFLINIKSNDPSEATKLVAYLTAHRRPIDQQLWVFADGRPATQMRKAAPAARIMSKASLKSCAYAYLALGWSGYVPASCRGQFMAVPINLRHAYWGWPDRFLARMREADMDVVLIGPVGGKEPGLAKPAQLDAVPPGFSGMVMTDDIEIIGPAMRRRWPAMR